MKKHSKLSILFWLWKSKAGKDGKAPIYARLTIDSEDVEMSTGRKVLPEFWNSESKTVNEKGAEGKKTNSHLRDMIVDLERLYTVLQSKYDQIDPGLLKMLYKNPFDQKLKQTEVVVEEEVLPQITLLDEADALLKSFKEEVDKNNKSAGTLRHWRSTRKKIHQFLNFNYQLEDIPITDIEYSFAEDFYSYLTISVDEPLAENTALKHISKTKQILKKAKQKKLITQNPLEEYSCYCVDPEVYPLEIYEVETIYRKNLPVQRLDQARDGFIFQCFTGFAFRISEILQLTI